MHRRSERERLALKKYLITGLLTWLPLVITAWVLLWLVGILDGVTLALLHFIGKFAPQNLEWVVKGFAAIPGLGTFAVLLIFFITGVLVTNVAGRWWVHYWESLLSRIPVIRPIYVAVKKVSNTLFSSNGQAFRQVLLVQFPRKDVWTLAFFTGAPSSDLQAHLQQAGAATGGAADDAWVSVYVPTTPNPTGGYFVMMRKTQVLEIDMTVDAALTYILSMGAVTPSNEPIAAPMPGAVQTAKPAPVDVR